MIPHARGRSYLPQFIILNEFILRIANDCLSMKKIENKKIPWMTISTDETIYKFKKLCQ